MQQQQNN
jgi:hypothetical protein